MLHSGRSHVGSVQAWRAAVKAVTYTTTTTTTTAVTINGVRTLELDGPWMTVFRSLMTPCARQHLASQRRPDLTYGCCHAEMPQFFSAVFVSSQTTAYWAQRSSTGRRLHSRRFGRRAPLFSSIYMGSRMRPTGTQQTGQRVAALKTARRCVAPRVELCFSGLVLAAMQDL